MNTDARHPRARASDRPDWTAGPAKWVAVALLGSLGTLGIARAYLAPPTPRLRPHAAGFAPTLSGQDTGARASEDPSPEPPAETLETRININTASVSELDLLPGVGRTLAERIVQDRAANGPFRSLDDLDRVPGFGSKKIAQLQPYAKVE